MGFKCVLMTVLKLLMSSPVISQGNKDFLYKGQGELMKIPGQ